MGKQYVIVEHVEKDNSLYIYKHRFDSIEDAENYEASYIYGYTDYYEVEEDNDEVIYVKKVG